MKLMTFLWGYTHNDFPNMCPYFWLSVFNVLFSIILVPSVGIAKLIKKMLDSYDNYCDKQAKDWAKEQADKIRKGDTEIVKFLYWNRMKTRWYKRAESILNYLSTEERDSYYKIYYQLEKQRDEEWERREEKAHQERIEKRRKEDQKTVKRRQRIGWWTSKLKIVVKFLMACFLASACIGLYFLVIEATTWNWSKIGRLSIDLLFIIAGIICIIFIAYGFYGLIKSILCRLNGYCFGCKSRKLKIINFFKKLTVPFIYFGKGIVWVWSGIVFIWDIVKALKNDNCPGIEWKD